MKTNRRFYLFATALIVFLQLSFGFQSTNSVYAEGSTPTPTPTASRGTCSEGSCG